MIEKFMPDIYVKSIYYINYDKLFKKGVRCLLFDLDNTIVPCFSPKPTKRLKQLFDSLKEKGFKIVIISNAPKFKVQPLKDYLEVDACAFALKPKKEKYEKILDKYKCKPSEVVAIGDQLITDVLGANKMDITSILVNPLTSKDHTATLINRILERIIFNKLSKKDLLKRGKYYE